MSDQPAISILIRTFNSALTLGGVLAKLPCREGDEIVIVDSGSTDTTLEIAEDHHATIIRSKPPFNYSRTLNEGFQLARNPWVLVISSHCIPANDDLLEMMRGAASGANATVAVAYGMTTLSAAKIPSRKAEGPSIVEHKQGSYSHAGNALAMYRREAWHRHPFDEALLTAEDLAWYLWATSEGYTAVIVQDAVGFYRNQGSHAHMLRKGWNETLTAVAMLSGRVPATTKRQQARRLMMNLGSLLGLLARREIPARTFTRQAAHSLGTFLAACFPGSSPWGA